MNEYLEFAKDLAGQAGEIMLKYFRNDEADKTWKEDLTPLTVADTKINSLVAQAIKEKYPTHGLIGEEESIEMESSFVWLCDPIDGTTPYSHGVPVATFNLALVEKGKVIVSVVLDPFNERLYTAVKGHGAFLNNVRLDISNDHTKTAYSREAIDLEIWGGKFGSIFKNDNITGLVLDSIDREQFSVFTFISIAYAAVLVASGEFGGLLFSGKQPWDLAAASLIVQEAGGIVTDLFGNEIEEFHKSIKGNLVGTPATHGQLLKDLLPVFEKAELE